MDLNFSSLDEQVERMQLAYQSIDDWEEVFNQVSSSAALGPQITYLINGWVEIKHRIEAFSSLYEEQAIDRSDIEEAYQNTSLSVLIKNQNKLEWYNKLANSQHIEVAKENLLFDRRFFRRDPQLYITEFTNIVGAFADILDNVDTPKYQEVDQRIGYLVSALEGGEFKKGFISQFGNLYKELQSDILRFNSPQFEAQGPETFSKPWDDISVTADYPTIVSIEPEFSSYRINASSDYLYIDIDPNAKQIQIINLDNTPNMPRELDGHILNLDFNAINGYKIIIPEGIDVHIVGENNWIETNFLNVNQPQDPTHVYSLGSDNLIYTNKTDYVKRASTDKVFQR
ncbi:hypothetical protein HN415_06715 [Candidatus Woesearchaeota archaeon]|jgi:hypothetical protein|nr:hypothetical protein [Candidatus Woesearchaeota archaeon]